MSAGGALEVWAPDGIGEVESGEDLAALVWRHLEPENGDIVVITSKAVSKAEGRVRPGPVTASLAAESQRVLARSGSIVIVKGRLGITQAMAGLDASNVAAGTHALLPLDPDASAELVRAGLWERESVNVGVLISDTAGRAWRIGQTEIAIGAAGMLVTQDLQGQHDGYGQRLARTQPCVADELCNAAELVQGKTSRRPLARIRGRADLVCAPGRPGVPAASLNRPEDEDLFGLGATEAVLCALSARAEDLPAFGAPVDAAILAEALDRVVPGTTLDWDQAAPARAVARVADPHESPIVRAVAFAHGWHLDPIGAASQDARHVTLVPGLLRDSP
jgi:coenzyme F420-0:L-glutamate ligase / coenzyme F420-1:gamma-L-glutamate ligase